MAWSAENATKAFLRTLKSGKNAMEPDVAEFISAMAAGNNAHFMVEATAGAAGPTTLALLAAAQQTGGRVVCIVPGTNELRSSVLSLGTEANHAELVIGDARELLLREYRGADFVLVDGDLAGHEGVFLAAQASAMEACGGVVVGYNALHKGSWPSSGGLKADLLPIGDGLRVSRVPPAARRSQWVVRVDECTGEEHVFRVRSPRGLRHRTHSPRAEMQMGFSCSISH